jgi:hypothetical protein
MEKLDSSAHSRMQKTAHGTHLYIAAVVLRGNGFELVEQAQARHGVPEAKCDNFSLLLDTAVCRT